MGGHGMHMVSIQIWSKPYVADEIHQCQNTHIVCKNDDQHEVTMKWGGREREWEDHQVSIIRRPHTNEGGRCKVDSDKKSFIASNFCEKDDICLVSMRKRDCLCYLLVYVHTQRCQVVSKYRHVGPYEPSEGFGKTVDHVKRLWRILAQRFPCQLQWLMLQSLSRLRGDKNAHKRCNTIKCEYIENIKGREHSPMMQNGRFRNFRRPIGPW